MTSSYSPVLTTKAVKDETEQRILRDAHVCHLHTRTQLYTNTTLPSERTRHIFMDHEICSISPESMSLTFIYKYFYFFICFLLIHFSSQTQNDTSISLSKGFAACCADVKRVCVCCRDWRRCAGEGCRGRHAAADVAGEDGAEGWGDWAHGFGIRQLVSQVSRQLNTQFDDKNMNFTAYFHFSCNHSFCSKQKDSKGPSFATISASGPNAALAHYR